MLQGYLVIGIILLMTGCQGFQSEKKMGYCFDAAFDPYRMRLYVAAGKAGLHTLDVVDNQLRYVSTYYDGGYYRNLELRGNLMYIADTERGLVVLDVSGDLPNTVYVQEGHGAGLFIEGDTLYLAAGDDGLQIFDITRPESPRMVSQIGSFGQAWDVWAHKGFAYVAAINTGLIVLDVSKPTKPQNLSSISWDEQNPMAEVIYGEGEYVYIAAGKHGLVGVDVADPFHPTITAKYNPGPESFGEGVFVKENMIYLAVGDKRNRDDNGLQILDATNPYSLVLLAKLNFDDWVEGVFVAGRDAFITNTFSGVRYADVGNPKDIRLIDHFAVIP
jgi:hypothetical protein